MKRRYRIHANQGVAAVLVAASTLFAASPAAAERLPITRFTTEEGLPSDSVHCALEDSRGFLWFGTSAGLARFDGHAFRSFGSERGLGEIQVSSLVEDEDGTLLVGTAAGSVYRFDPTQGGSFRTMLAPTAGDPLKVVLLRDRLGRVWAGRDGLYRLERVDGRPLFQRVAGTPAEVSGLVFSIAEDDAGTLWFGSKGLHVLSPDGVWSRVSLPAGFQWIASVAADTEGRIWAGAVEGLCSVEPRSAVRTPSGLPCRPLLLHGPSELMDMRLVVRPGGGVWAGSALAIFELDRDGRLLRRIGKPQGLTTPGAVPLILDRSGNPWFAATDAGIVRLALDGFTSFDSMDGLEAPRVGSIMRTRSGDLIVAGNDHLLQRLERGRLVAVRPRLPESIVAPGWGWHQYQIQDREGDWWIPTGNGIFRFGPVRHLQDLADAAPRTVYTTKDGLPSDDVFRLFEDSRGDIWVSTLWPHPALGTGAGPTLSRWERASGRFHQYGADRGVTQVNAATAFIELPDESIWIGFSEEGEVYRYRDGEFARLGLGGGFAGAFVSAFFREEGGTLWIAWRGGGVCRVDAPEAIAPSCKRITRRDGLASDEVNGIAQDAQGRIYLGTSQGVDVLEHSRPVCHLDRSHGLPHRYVNVVFDDPEGPIWFGTLNGLARLEPQRACTPPGAPRARIDGIRVAGIPRALSALGEMSIPDLVLTPAERRLQIDFISVSDEVGGPDEFQHRLDPSEPWSEPSPERTLLLPSLRPGRHRFEVRAVGTAGASPEPAIVSFRVLAPVWMRPWFVGLLAAAAMAAAVAGYRLRVAHLMALQRQQMRIAMDLHDELGSGLGSIGVLADLAAESGPEDPRRRDLLDQIATTASELGGSMGDIVWSLRSGSDSMESLARRLSERGRRLFPEGGAVLRTRFPDSWPEARLTLALRHSLAMIGLEAMHNAARHSGASVVTLEVAPEDGRWCLSVTDNGRGIPAQKPTEGSGSGGDGGGLGLTSMRRRAGEIGAALKVESREGAGTTVSVVFDARARKRVRLI